MKGGGTTPVDWSKRQKIAERILAEQAQERTRIPEQAKEQTQDGARTAPVRRSQENMTTAALLPDRCQSSGARAGTVRAPNEPEVSGLGAWWKKLAALVPSTKAAKGGAIGDRRPTQGELSLEKVRVVANDLSDADLEVVACKKETSTPKKSAARQLRNTDLQQQTKEKDLEPANQVTVGRS